MASTLPHIVILGNPGCRRVAFFQAALLASGQSEAMVVPYLDLLRGRVELEKALPPAGILRIESPGEDFAVERELLAAGADVADRELPQAARISRQAALNLPFEQGRLRLMRQLFLGFARLLERVDEALHHRPDIMCLNPVDDILTLCDKARCRARLDAAGLPVPRALPAVRSWDELRHRMEETGIRRVFVKPRHGSSAAGIIALEARPPGLRTGPAWQGFSTIELVSEGGQARFYNSLKVRRYTDQGELATMVDMLAREGVHVEQWLPKAGLQGHTFDLRVMAIAGQARHVVVRMSRSPMTNLHLLNQRASPALLRERLHDAAWRAAMDDCAACARRFPRTLHLGLDLCFSPGLRRHAILEVNAFGDLLPGCLHEGQDTYSAEIAALTDRLAGRNQPVFAAGSSDKDDAP